MASLIVGSIYLAHKGATGAYREKQRRKNYERWEGLRDEYDAQKKISRETRSLDIQRTGSADFGTYDDRPIVSLRDLQEANDARTGWRPQESWEQSTYSSPSPAGPATGQQQSVQQSTYTSHYDSQGKPVATPSSYWQGRGEIRPQKTGATWDDGLPAPLRVTRRSVDDYDHNSQYQAPSRTQSLHRDAISRKQSSRHPSQSPSQRQPPTSAMRNQSPPHNETPHASHEPVAMDAHFIQQLTGVPVAVEATPMQPFFMDSLKSPPAVTVYPVPVPTQQFQPPQQHLSQTPVPGGRMAELIERGY